MKRRAPRDGYDFGNKRQYRRTIWRRFADHCGTARAASHALLMPSSEGDEIDVALANRFRCAHLHVVDRNAAIVAHIKRRFPKVNTYGVELVRACERIVRSGIVLSVANFDLCAPVSTALVRMLQPIGLSGVFDSHSLVAVTMLRGREQGIGTIRDVGILAGEDDVDGLCGLHRYTYPEDYTAADRGRCELVGASLTNPIAGLLARPTGTGIYRSTAGTQTMMWCIYRFCQLEPWAVGFTEGSAQAEWRSARDARESTNAGVATYISIDGSWPVEVD